MNPKQVAILIVVLALCVGGVFIVNSKKDKTIQQPSDKIGDQPFAGLAVNDVTALTVKDKEDSVELAKVDGEWQVANRGGYPADFTRLSNLLRGLLELKVADAVALGGAGLERLDLAAPGDNPEAEGTGTVVALSGDGGEMASFTLGKEYEGGQTSGPFGNFANSTGRFLKKGNDVVIISDTVTDASSKPADWLNKDFFKVQKLKSIAFAAEDDADSWTMTRTDALGDFTLEEAAEGEELDTAKIGAMKNAFSAPSFKDVVADPDNATTGLDSPQTFTVDTFEGFTYVINVGDATEDGDFYLTVDADGGFETEYVPEPKAGDDEAAGDDAPAADADAELSAEEKAKKEEEEKAATEAEAKRKEEEFKAELERKQEKLEAEKAYSGIVYLVNKWSVDSVLKKRSEILRPDEDPTAPVDATGLPGGLPDGFPGGLTPPTTFTPSAGGGGGTSQPRITAVTPPIEVPPPVVVEEEEGAEGENSAEEAVAEEPGEDSEVGEIAPADDE